MTGTYYYSTHYIITKTSFRLLARISVVCDWINIVKTT